LRESEGAHERRNPSRRGGVEKGTAKGFRRGEKKRRPKKTLRKLVQLQASALEGEEATFLNERKAQKKKGEGKRERADVASPCFKQKKTAQTVGRNHGPISRGKRKKIEVARRSRTGMEKERFAETVAGDWGEKDSRRANRNSQGVWEGGTEKGALHLGRK